MVRESPATRPLILAACLLAGGLFAAGCATGETTKNESANLVLELSVKVAALDLDDLNRRMTSADVRDLWSVMQREKAEILVVQNITRYPGLATRTDLLDEFTKVSGWRSAWGELVDNSGRLNGNAVFSVYPIRSRSTIPFNSVKGAVFEGALHTVIDGGVREIIVVSATYPEKGGDGARNACRNLITEARGNPSAPMILSGGNPAPREGWNEVFSAGTPVGLQYDGVGGMRSLSSSTVSSKLGKIALATFGLYRNQ